MCCHPVLCWSSTGLATRATHSPLSSLRTHRSRLFHLSDHGFTQECLVAGKDKETMPTRNQRLYRVPLVRDCAQHFPSCSGGALDTRQGLLIGRMRVVA